jgi:hypothetical protein
VKDPAAIGIAVLERLAAQAAVNRARGAARRAEVQAIMARHSGRLSARQVLQEWAHDKRPSVRRVQEILSELRAESSASRREVKQTDAHGNPSGVESCDLSSARLLTRGE